MNTISPSTSTIHTSWTELLGLPKNRRCDFLLSFGYPADPSKLTCPNKPGGRRSFDEVVRETAGRATLRTDGAQRRIAGRHLFLR